jgi:hypothetical protein
MIKAGMKLSSFLAERPGVYTGMRTVNQHSLFSFQEHVERLTRLR